MVGKYFRNQSTLVRKFFIYLSFVTLGSPLLIYFPLAFFLENIDKLKWRKKERQFGTLNNKQNSIFLMNKLKILVTGSNGLLGQKIVYQLAKRKNVELFATAKGPNRLKEKIGYQFIDLDITIKDQVYKIINILKPHAVINCAAMTNVDACEKNQEDCYKINVKAVEYIAIASESIKAHLVQLSTDFIFDGKCWSILRRGYS